jgi:hypothetical protein
LPLAIRTQNSDPETAALVRGLPAETTMALKWIAAKLQLGSWTHVSNLLGQKNAKSVNRG